MSDEAYGALAHTLEVLASPTRLQILRDLRSPKALHEIRAAPSAPRPGENPERPLARQTVAHHLGHLVRCGLVRRLDGDPRAPRFLLDAGRVFALVDTMRVLAQVRPVDGGAASDETVGHGALGALLPRPPRLVLAYGREEGVGFSLDGPPGSQWRIGRSEACEVRLDYDVYLSRVNSVVERTQDGFVVHDVPPGRNGTSLNWERLPPGGTRDLRSGDLVGVGRSLLVLQE
jgi:DNA-binding transcriptional ArsR family regulator